MLRSCGSIPSHGSLLFAIIIIIIIITIIIIIIIIIIATTTIILMHLYSYFDYRWCGGRSISSLLTIPLIRRG